ncbi:DUF4748 domain-containing protein [Scomber japonicus]|uniref:DUF4748 domain-containing protein n=1 Tax=Scomber japonicus TaxID=13676 RepID=UPI0023056BC0|nr:DUF4748 domain-containing protein [Scomber japonicus]
MTLKGVPSRWLLTQSCQSPASSGCLRLQAARCRTFQVSPAASMCSSRTETQRSTHTGDKKAKVEEEEEEDDGPEYIPRRKAKNPMMKIGYAWMIGLPTGIIGFLLAKREVDKNRLKQLKVRQRMRRSNDGIYEGGRSHHQATDVKLDQ